MDITRAEPLAVKIGRMELAFVAVETTAPKAYDFGGQMTLEVYAAPDVSFRVVLVEETRVDAQIARYASGLHGGKVFEADEASIRAKLVERLFGREEG